MDWLQPSEEPACGWLETDGLGIAFRRTPNGADAIGRGGAFFSHALVWKAGSLPPGVLGRLWSAGIWVTEPPPPLAEPLQPLRGVDDLRLGPAPPVDAHLLTEALARTLAHLAKDASTTLHHPPELAIPIAAAIAESVPAAYGLLSFSSWEPNATAEKYDLVGATPIPDGLPAPAPASAMWTTAARVLLAARAGDHEAREAVSAVEAQSPNVVLFASNLSTLAAVELGAHSPDFAPNEAQASLIASDPRLFDRAIARGGAGLVARGLFVGDRFRESLVRAAKRSSSPGAILDAAGIELARLGAARGLAFLSGLHDRFGPEAQRAAESLAAAWPEDRLRTIEPGEALDLAMVLSAGHRTTESDRALDQLISDPRLTLLLAGAALPSAVRARAAAANPALVSGPVLSAAVARDPQFATTFLALGGPDALTALRAAIEEAPMPLAFQCASQAAACVAPDDVLSIVWAPILRLDPARRLRALDRWAPTEAVMPSEWVDLTMATFIDVVLDIRDTEQALPYLASPAARVDTRGVSDAAVTWLRTSRALAGTGPVAGHGFTTLNQIDDAAHSISAMIDPRARDAALEALVDTCVVRATGDWDDWLRGLELAQRSTTESVEAFAERVARAALRRAHPPRERFAPWVIRWVALAIEQDALPSKAARRGRLAELHTRLWPMGATRVEAYAAEDRWRSRAARQWLESNAKAAKRAEARR